MRRVLAAVLLTSVAGVANAQPAAPAPEQTAEVQAALARVAPSLVRIHVVSVDFQDGRELKREASGSGTIISPTADTCCEAGARNESIDAMMSRRPA